MTNNVVQLRSDPHFRPVFVHARDGSGKGHWWRGPGEIWVSPGHESTPVAFEVLDQGSDKFVLIQMQIEDARWLAARLLKFAEHAERYPPRPWKE